MILTLRPSENSTLSAADSIPLNTNGPSAWIDFPIPLAAGLLLHYEFVAPVINTSPQGSSKAMPGATSFMFCDAGRFVGQCKSCSCPTCVQSRSFKL